MEKESTVSVKSSKSSKETLEGIFEETLRDIYWAELQLVKSLPKMQEAAFNEELKDAFEKHLHETTLQVSRVESCFEILQMKPVAKKCEAMEGLIKEGTRIISEHESGNARDAALIAAAQKIEHYEISAYGTLRTMATVIGRVQCAALLEENKDEEAETDEALTALAVEINKKAFAAAE